MDHRIAIFIDAENVSPNDLGIIFDEINNYGNIVINRAYGDWSKSVSFKNKSIEYGIELIQANSISGKNSSDIKLCVDAMNVLHTLNEISIFYIVTSDSDFIHLVPYIKCLNKEVRCIGYEKTNRGLQNIVNMFTKIEVLRKTNEETEIEISDEIKDEISLIFLNNETINIGRLYDILKRKHQFDYREYNCKSMSKFLDKYYNEYIESILYGGTIKIKQE